MAKVDVLVPTQFPEPFMTALDDAFALHCLWQVEDPAAYLDRHGDRIRGIARCGWSGVDRAMIDRLPRLEIIASWAVGYDMVDVVRAGERGIVVTNTPDVLTEEVADTALGLLLMTVRELSAAERYLRAGKWRSGDYPLTRMTLRNRTVGIVGLGRIGLAIARRLDASQVPVAYHNRNRRTDVPYRYYADLVAMAREVDTLMIVLPGGKGTEHIVDAAVIDALGPNGVLVNIGRGSVVDEDALVAALVEGRLAGAGLDVFRKEPQVPEALLALDNVVLLPHVGSASVATRDAMFQLVVDNLVSWFRDGRPLTPVPETPWPR